MNRTIVVFDRDLAEVQRIAHWLQAEHYTAVVATDGNDALSKVMQE